MGSNETATATTGGPRVIAYLTGTGAPSGPNCTLFSGVDRLPEVSRGVFWVATRRVQTPTLLAPPLPSGDTYQYRSSALRAALVQVPNVFDPQPTGELQARAHAA